MSRGSAIVDQEPEHARSQPGYGDVDRLENSDRLVAVISQRSWDGELTFGIFREFDRRPGEVSRTSFVPESLGASYQAIVDLALARMKELRDQAQKGVVKGSPSTVWIDNRDTWAVRDASDRPILPFPLDGWKARRR